MGRDCETPGRPPACGGNGKPGPVVLGTQTGVKTSDRELQFPGDVPKETLAHSILHIGYRIRWILYLVALVSLQSGLAGPSVQFIMTSFFAEGDGGNCEDHPMEEACRRGASELAFYSGVSNGLSHAVAWAVALVLGSWSDAMGRRPWLRAKAAAAVLPAAALCAHVLWGCTLWAYLVLNPMMFAFDTVPVFLASMNDLVAEPHLRSGAFGTLMGFFIFTTGLSLPLGGLLPQSIAVAAYFAVCLVQVAYVFTCLPETLPSTVARKKPPGLCAIIRKGIEVFGRNDFIARMVLILVLSGFSSAGLGTLLPSYAMAYLGFNRKLGTILTFICGTSIGLCLLLLLPRMLGRLGDVGTMKASLLLAVLYPLLIPMCSDAMQFMLLTGVFIGPMAMVFPVITSIKSNLVGEDEQGIVQGALAAVRVLAVAFSDPLFGWLYRHSTDNGAKASRFAALLPILCVAGLAALACLAALGLAAAPPAPGGESRGGRREEEEAVELTVAGGPTD